MCFAREIQFDLHTNSLTSKDAKLQKHSLERELVGLFWKGPDNQNAGSQATTPPLTTGAERWAAGRVR